MLEADYQAPSDLQLLRLHLSAIIAFFDACSSYKIPAAGVIRICVSAMEVIRNASLVIPLLDKRGQTDRRIAKPAIVQNSPHTRTKQIVLSEFYKVVGRNRKSIGEIAKEINDRLGSKRADDPSESKIISILKREVVFKDDL
jgi:hypothetical protein